MQCSQTVPLMVILVCLHVVSIVITPPIIFGGDLSNSIKLPIKKAVAPFYATSFLILWILSLLSWLSICKYILLRLSYSVNVQPNGSLIMLVNFWIIIKKNTSITLLFSNHQSNHILCCLVQYSLYLAAFIWFGLIWNSKMIFFLIKYHKIINDN